METNKIPAQTVSVKNRKWLPYAILSVSFVICLFQLRSLDNDFYFLYATGDYITKHGFPYSDMLSMHSSMKIVVQQWLSDVIFYYVYSLFGEFGIFTVVYLCYAGICLLTYRLIHLISDNKLLAAIVSASVCFLLFDPFIVTRPQIFTYIVLLAEVCLLEKHAKTNDIKPLIAIPFLSLLLINLHAAMWALILVFMVPFLLGSIPLHIKSLELKPSGKPLAIIITMAFSLIAGILNPYSIDGMLYLTSSYGQDNLSVISEMSPTSLDCSEGKMFFIVASIVLLIAFFRRKIQFSARFFCLFAGTLTLGLLQIKGIPYFFLIGVPASTYLLKDIEFSKLKSPLKNTLTKTTKVLIGIFLSLIIVWLCEARFFITAEIINDKKIYLERLDNAIAIMNESDEPVVLYTNFNDGQYLEFHGYHPYIDGRAELFLFKNNHYYDYFYEYTNLLGGYTYYRDFTDKYGFNYLIVNSQDDSHLYSCLLRDDDFELVYSTPDVNLFKRVEK